MVHRAWENSFENQPRLDLRLFDLQDPLGEPDLAVHRGLRARGRLGGIVNQVTANRPVRAELHRPHLDRHVAAIGPSSES